MSFILFHIIAFLASFLLFQIELIIAKLFLPIYGGCYFVWGACLVFFQTMLLLGYASVHGLTRRYGITRYRGIHLILVFIPFLFFPGKSINAQTAAPGVFLTVDVFWRLLIAIGPVFFVLSTTGVALQVWLASSSLKQKINPYTLYATSNAGSLSALLTYPFFFERTLGLNAQQMLWRWGYALLVMLTVALFKAVPVINQTPFQSVTGHPKTAFNEKLGWFLLSAGGVMLFMSVTTILTESLSPAPLLWIIPLSLYLLTFVLGFKTKPWCPRWIKKNSPFILLGGCALFFVINKNKPSLVEIKLIASCALLFIICLYSQNLLSERRPSDKHELTEFYRTLAMGGCFGGILTSWVIPLISVSYIEYLLALSLVAMAASFLTRDTSTRPPRLWARIRAWSLVAVPVFFIFFWLWDSLGNHPNVCLKRRNYYGIYKVFDFHGVRVLSHGTTIHGAQLLDKRLILQASAYYSSTSPVGEIFLSTQFDFKKIGVLGLGAGTLAIYSKPGQAWDFFELDPDMALIAKKYFTYLDHAAGKIQFIYGDGRLSLNKLKDTRYDLLIVDAFGGDAVPVHLLTQEAILEYREHLNPDGLILFHISNRFIRLMPVLTESAKNNGAFIGYRSTEGQPYGIKSVWAAMTWDRLQAIKLTENKQWFPATLLHYKIDQVWTDDYSSIVPLIK